jgi:hypothetical protein
MNRFVPFALLILTLLAACAAPIPAATPTPAPTSTLVPTSVSTATEVAPTPAEATEASSMTASELEKYTDGIQFDARGKHWEIVTNAPGLDLKNQNVQELMEMLEFKDAMSRSDIVRIQFNYYDILPVSPFRVNNRIGFMKYDGAYNINITRDYLTRSSERGFLGMSLIQPIAMEIYWSDRNISAQNIDYLEFNNSLNAFVEEKYNNVSSFGLDVEYAP